MGACPLREAWLPSVGLLWALALLGLPRASGNCSTPPTIPYAHPEESYDADKTFGDGTTITYKCDTGYAKIPGKSNSVTCQGVEWSEIPQFCNRSCNQPPRYNTMQPDSAFISQNYFPINSTVTFVCRPGHSLIKLGPLLSICQDDGSWSPISESCKKKSCPTPVTPDHGQIMTPTDILFGSKIEYSCDEGYHLIGDAVRHCTLSNNQVLWSGESPVCEITTCLSPPNINNGKHNGGHKDVFTYGETVTYHCDLRAQDQFSLIGEATITCAEHGEWNKPTPECKVVKCTTPYVPNAVQVSGFGSSHTYKDTIVFECKEGYILQNNRKITCEADNKWKPELPICSEASGLPSSQAPPATSRPGTTIASQTKPPVSRQPGPSLPPVEEPPSGQMSPGIIALIAIAAIVFVIIILVISHQYNKKKGTYITDEIHKEDTVLNSLKPHEEA
ncbi:membrane cofactor protein-like isoform X2 [Monodelphis domestica]|uniref:Membrane cofactor protein-like n=1 Tax=Monodelphis domestica TaxID=13616 RepID=A0A5F8G6I3_MONDO|nr:membrane cofactor protein-like isoform X2 [Monodelphis domestica]XP_056671847.1 membrane cofactor protein-like isoform X2 [Monodelphis domestica]